MNENTILRPIIYTGTPFDWEYGKDAILNIIDGYGNVDWRNAFSADPGVIHCKFCDQTLWNEGELIECPNCHGKFINQKGQYV